MLSAKSQLSYFENLEKAIKIALAAHIIILISGVLLVLWQNVGMISIFIGVLSFRSMFLGCVIIGFYILLYSRISKMHRLGELNIWLDRKFFGFLKKSNETIFHTLITSLRPAERNLAYHLESQDKEVLTQSVFSKLASDNYLFQMLLRSNIFRFWIWYWIMNYGTVTFTILTIVIFPFVIVNQIPFTTTIFTVFWVLAIAHLLSCLILGYRLLRMTKSVVEDIVKSHANDIALLLREQLWK